ncbi:disintegrin and metalloproteinase domain-containing protein 32-like isoform X1 [Gallus gallus]|uniref:disintegrin and metalloproteinase domain-containing protein 32-like isoform X1 n=1 Tax=Gallus gallus TaxID=9031 RepID=UPI0003506468|nr:disintegrin and metalloproteinase domain-containing protein 32-like isoform X1 [Gallus gallus]
MGPCLVLGAALLAALCPRASSQITTPLRLPPNETGLSDTLSYILTVEGKPYTIHLKKHVFIRDDFRIYMSDETGFSMSDSTHIRGDCYYHGSIEGVPSSAVTLSACAGLRGLLQFHNASFGIEPLDSSPTFEHFVYRMSSENTAGFLFAQSRPRAAGEGLQEPPSDAAQLPKYVEVYVVLDKALYNYLGSDLNAVTQKMIQVFSFVNNIFNPLNMTVVLSSMELWMQQNRIPTDGAADELLQQFLQWKRSHLALQPYDVTYLFVYRDQADFAVATSPGTLCGSDASSAVAVLQRAVTLESFSVLLAQLLGRSLGMGFDDGRGCRCPTHTCVMESAALHISGTKAFSSCSTADLEQFLRRDGGRCLLHGPPLQGSSPRRSPTCGNGVVERGEQCDCGSAEACSKDKCCAKGCVFKPRAKCSSGLCCEGCQFKAPNTLCRPSTDAQCDLPEFCNGSSASCPPDVYVQDGHSCEHGTGYCYRGHCQSAELQCQQLYGRGSRSAPVVCYEELNSQRDRFGHCGYHPRHGYRACAWRNLRCGKLICTYPHSAPLETDTAAVIYARVREQLCVSLYLLNAPASQDPLLVPAGTKCGSEMVCINSTCHPHSVLGYDCNSEIQCHGHGVCNNRRHCHCHPGWKPPDCRQRGSRLGGSIDSGVQLPQRSSPQHRTQRNAERKGALLAACLLLPAVPVALLLVLLRRELRVRRFGNGERIAEERSEDAEEEQKEEDEAEGNAAERGGSE